MTTLSSNSCDIRPKAVTGKGSVDASGCKIILKLLRQELMRRRLIVRAYK